MQAVDTGISRRQQPSPVRLSATPVDPDRHRFVPTLFPAELVAEGETGRAACCGSSRQIGPRGRCGQCTVVRLTRFDAQGRYEVVHATCWAVMVTVNSNGAG